MLSLTILIERLKTFKILSGIIGKNPPLEFLRIMFNIPLFSLSSIFFTFCKKRVLPISRQAPIIEYFA